MPRSPFASRSLHGGKPSAHTWRRPINALVLVAVVLFLTFVTYRVAWDGGPDDEPADGTWSNVHDGADENLNSDEPLLEQAHGRHHLQAQDKSDSRPAPKKTKPKDSDANQQHQQQPALGGVASGPVATDAQTPTRKQGGKTGQDTSASTLEDSDPEAEAEESAKSSNQRLNPTVEQGTFAESVDSYVNASKTKTKPPAKPAGSLGDGLDALAAMDDASTEKTPTKAEPKSKSVTPGKPAGSKVSADGDSTAVVESATDAAKAAPKKTDIKISSDTKTELENDAPKPDADRKPAAKSDPETFDPEQGSTDRASGKALGKTDPDTNATTTAATAASKAGAAADKTADVNLKAAADDEKQAAAKDDAKPQPASKAESSAKDESDAKPQSDAKPAVKPLAPLPAGKSGNSNPRPGPLAPAADGIPIENERK
nr:hypothetical protein HK105_000432 [Polyrhizophydium stewartii]